MLIDVGPGIREFRSTPYTRSLQKLPSAEELCRLQSERSYRASLSWYCRALHNCIVTKLQTQENSGFMPYSPRAVSTD
jgi:hypothetical protein